MLGRACKPKVSNEITKALVMCYRPKKDYYKKFLFEPYPVESHLNNFLVN